MDVQAKRIEIAKWVLSLEEEVLEKLDTLKNRTTSKIVAFTVHGEALTKKQYAQKLKEAEQQIDAGNFTTHEDLKREMQDW